MDPQRPPPHQPVALPPITSITHFADNPPPTEMSPLPFRTAPPHPDPLRDSGNWSASKHSSGVSNNGFPLTSILNTEDSPSRNSIPSSIPETPLSSKGALQPLPPISQTYDPRSSADATSMLDSRRSSVDSRMNMGMGHLQISPSAPTPYDKSQNVSRTSIVSNLQQQRGIATDQRPLSGPMSPVGQRSNGLRTTPRRAPVINPNPRTISEMPNPTAENPTKGFPWAFPDSQPPEHQRRSSSGDSEHRPSRQNSFAASVNSSIFTNDSALPPGQKRFSEGDMPHTHHHSMQGQVGALRPDGLSVASPGAGSYSRTPELRISHKMAERKRRSEMKNLFDELNQILPSPAGGKSSKWEVLTRAIEYINKNKGDLNRVSSYRNELDKSRGETAQIRDEANAMWQNLRRLEPNHPHIYGPYTSGLAQQHQPADPAAMARPLPPMQGQWPPNAGQMQGVEYAPTHGYDRR